LTTLRSEIDPHYATAIVERQGSIGGLG
jgi:hypothetical protein